MHEFALYLLGVVGWLVAYALVRELRECRRQKDRLIGENKTLSQGLRYCAERIDELHEEIAVRETKVRHLLEQRGRRLHN